MLNKRFKNTEPSSTLRINEISNKLLDEGKNVYKFGLGQSPFPVPEILIETLKKNAHQKDYLNVSGLLKLREVVAKYHSKKNLYNYSEDNVIIGPGSKELIFQCQMVTEMPLLLPKPSWVSYEPQAKILKSVGKKYELLWPKIGWKKEGLWTRYPGSFCWSLEAPDGHMPLINQLRGVRLMDSILRHPAIAERHNNIL